MKYYQVLTGEGDEVALFYTVSDEDKSQIISDAFAVGKARQEHYLENNYEEEIDVLGEAEEYLAKRGIHRIYVELVITDNI